jgi:hypothetical protein
VAFKQMDKIAATDGKRIASTLNGFHIVAKHFSMTAQAVDTKHGRVWFQNYCTP